MILFKKENGFPCDIQIETEEVKSKDFVGFKSIVYDDKHNPIKEFYHSRMRDRAHWADGFFTALKFKSL